MGYVNQFIRKISLKLRYKNIIYSYTHSLKGFFRDLKLFVSASSPLSELDISETKHSILQHLEGMPCFTSSISTSLSLKLSDSKSTSFEVPPSGNREGFTSSPFISISGVLPPLSQMQVPLGKDWGRQNSVKKKTECELDVIVSVEEH